MLHICKDPRQEFKYSYSLDAGDDSDAVSTTQPPPRNRMAPRPRGHDPLQRNKLSFWAFNVKYQPILARIHEACIQNARLFSARDVNLCFDEAGLRSGLERYLYDTFDTFDCFFPLDYDICMPE
jgi:hypothetical protein